VLRRNRNAPMYMIRHQVPFENLAFFLPRQGMENLSQLAAHSSEYHLAPSLGDEHHVVFAVPF